MLVFAGSCFLLLAAPGPTNALLMEAGVRRGLSAAGLLGAVAAGYACSVGGALLALGPAIAACPLVATVLKGVCAVWLLRTAVVLWRRPAQAQTSDFGFRTVFTTTLLNPKGLVVAFGLMPETTGAWTLAAHLAAFATMAPVVGSAWLALGASLRRSPGARYAPRAAALVLGGFGVALGASLAG